MSSPIPTRDMTLTLEFPMPPNLANRPMHHMVKHRVKLGYWALLDLMHGVGYDHQALGNLAKVSVSTRIEELRKQIVAAQLFATRYVQEHASQIVGREKPVAARWAKAQIHSTMYLGAPMDHGNAMNRHKWIEDWLVTRGFLLDDKAANLEWKGMPTQIVKRDGNYRIVLSLIELTV